VTSTVVEHRDDAIRLALGDLAVTVPTTTPPEAVDTIERLLGLIDRLADRTAQLHVALESRVTIEQAKGILAERMQVSPDEAFNVLRSTARRRRVSMHRLADAIVRGRGEPLD
jgi:AmiR/NasT family two-component response regulator